MKKDKILVIGGSSGIGFGIAKGMSALGHDVLIASRSKEKLKKAKKALKKIKTYPLDITNEKQIKTFFSKIPSFDHLVITAAAFVLCPFLKMKSKDAKAYFDSKFWGQYFVAKYAVPKIKKNGSIIFFSGIVAHKPLVNFSIGAATNGAIEGLTRALAVELAPLRVNAISPGVVETPLWGSKKESGKQLKKIASTLPVKRVGQPEDFAHAGLLKTGIIDNCCGVIFNNNLQFFLFL